VTKARFEQEEQAWLALARELSRSSTNSTGLLLHWAWAAPQSKEWERCGALEFAGYAALVHGDHRLAHFWWDRDQSADAEKNVRRAFTHGAVREASDPAPARISRRLITVPFLHDYGERAVASPGQECGT
jgi:hypothetical protein